MQLVSAEVARLPPRLQQEILLARAVTSIWPEMEETVGGGIVTCRTDRRSAFKTCVVELGFGNKEKLIFAADAAGRFYDRGSGAHRSPGSGLFFLGEIYLRVIDFKHHPTADHFHPYPFPELLARSLVWRIFFASTIR